MAGIEGGWPLTRRPVGREGLVLPITLLLLLASMAAATSVFVLARSERILGGADLRFLEERLSERSPAGSVPIQGGYRLLRLTGVGPGAVSWGLGWELVPDSLLPEWPWALEVGFLPPSTGVATSPECGGASHPTTPLVRVRGGGWAGGADPPISPPPRLGPLGIPELRLLMERELRPGEGWGEGGVDARLLLVAGGFSTPPGEGEGVLVAEGDLTLSAGSHFRGLVLVGGDLLLASGSSIEGVALVRGRARLEEGGHILGCPDAAAAALTHPALARVHAVAGGERLGRF